MISIQNVGIDENKINYYQNTIEQDNKCCGTDNKVEGKDSGIITDLTDNMTDNKMCSNYSEDLDNNDNTKENESADNDTEGKMQNTSLLLNSSDIENIEADGKSVEDMAIDELFAQTKKNLYKQNIEEDEVKSEAINSILFSIKDLFQGIFEMSGMPNSEDIKNNLIDDNAKRYLLVNGLEPTVINVYRAKYAGKSAENSKMQEDVFSDLKGRVTDILEDAGIECSEENMDKAKWIIENDIPFSAETLKAYDQIENINNYTEEDYKNIAKIAVLEGIDVNDISLLKVSESEISEIKIEIEGISDEAISNVIESDSIICIKNLVESQKDIDAAADILGGTENQKETDYLDVIINGEEVQVEDNEELQTLKVRIQLEEIRLKLSLQSSYQLSKNGIDIRTNDISKVVEELKSIEDSFYKALLGDNATDDNVDIVKKVDESVATIKESPAYLLGKTISVQDSITLSQLTIEAKNVKSEMAQSTYEALMTAPRKDMGDSINKAFRNVDDLIKDTGLKVTPANQRAVRILAYNNMEITSENINNIKSYDARVQELFNNLTPSTTVELINKDINPLKVSFDELSKTVVDIKNNNEQSNDESFSKYLWQLDKQGELSQEQRDTYIGVYRLINAVNKSDGAAIGALVNSGMELNLSNLLTSVRIRNNKGVNVEIDDEYGVLDKIVQSDNNIKSQIEASFSDNNSGNNYNSFQEQQKGAESMLRQVQKNITPDIIDDEIMKTPLEELFDKSKEIAVNVEKEDSKYYEEKIANLREALTQVNSTKTLLENMGMDYTIGNLISTEHLVYGSGIAGSFVKLFKNKNNTVKSSEDNTDNNSITDNNSDSEILNLLDLTDRLTDTLVDADSMKKQYEEINSSVEKLSNIIKSDYKITSTDLSDIRMLRKDMEFAINLSKRECYEIPLVIDGEITEINLTVLHNQENKNNVQISMNSEELGRINASFKINNNKVRGLIIGDFKDGVAQLLNSSDNLKEQIEEAGLDIESLDYGTNTNLKVEYNIGDIQNESSESTAKLYTVAKAMIKNIKYTINLLR